MRPLRGMADARGRRDRRDRRARLDVLAERPRPLLGALGELQVAPRHVEAAGVAVDRVERVGGGDLERPARRARRRARTRNDSWSCPADRAGSRRILPQRRRALGEIERLLAVDDMAHLARVFFVVAADAEDARDRIALARGRRLASDGAAAADRTERRSSATPCRFGRRREPTARRRGRGRWRSARRRTDSRTAG